jgi:uncharacterized membrane protein
MGTGFDYTFLQTEKSSRFRTASERVRAFSVRKRHLSHRGEKKMVTRETALTGSKTGQGNQTAEQSKNVGEVERYASAIGGGALALYGLSRGSLAGVTLALVGGALIYRGVSGHCNMYEAMGVNTAREKGSRASVSGDRGIKVEKSITINRSPEELFSFWRNFENLPRFMDHLESVRTTSQTRSHWVAKAPAGTTVEWDAEIINEKPNELIAWRSLEGADVDNAGSVRFERAASGTTVRVTLEYDPPAGIVGAAVAKLFGEAPDQQIEDDLQRFKQVMETGEGQSSGRTAGATNG